MHGEEVCAPVRSLDRGASAAPESGLAQDPVHLGATDRADSLGHPAAVGLVDLAFEVPLFLAFDAVAVVGLGHQPCSSPRAAGGRAAGRTDRPGAGPGTVAYRTRRSVRSSESCRRSIRVSA